MKSILEEAKTTICKFQDNISKYYNIRYFWILQIFTSYIRVKDSELYLFLFIFYFFRT